MTHNSMCTFQRFLPDGFAHKAQREFRTALDSAGHFYRLYRHLEHRSQGTAWDCRNSQRQSISTLSLSHAVNMCVVQPRLVPFRCDQVPILGLLPRRPQSIIGSDDLQAIELLPPASDL